MPRRKRELKTLREVADEFGFKVRTVRSWVANRVLWSTKIGGLVFVDRAEIERLITENERPSERQILERVLPR